MARCDFGVVEFFVGVAAFDEDGAFERDTCEEAFGFAVGEDAGYAFEACGSCGFSVSAYWACCYADVAAECDGGLLGEGADCRCVVQDEDEVGELDADLSTESAASGADGGGG